MWKSDLYKAQTGSPLVPCEPTPSPHISVLTLSDAFLSERKQIPEAMFLHRAESLPGIEEADIAAKS